MPNGGVFRDLFRGTPLEKVGLVPKLTTNEIVIEINEEQFKQIALEGVDPKIRQYIDVKILNGKIVMKIKLW